MKTFKLLSILFLFTLSTLTSCSKDDILEIDTSILTFQSGIDTKSFNITATGEWEITCEGLTAGYGIHPYTEWFSINPAGGKGNATITITTKEETSDYNTTLYIKQGSIERIVELKQN